jgi:hypothetical protein
VLNCRGGESRRGRQRLGRTGKIQRLRQFDRRFDGRLDCYCRGWGQNERDRRKERALGIMTAGHRAGHHSSHVMTAIHVIGGCGRSFLVMMPSNRTLTGHAASGHIRRPRGARERRVKQRNHEQADACGNRSAAMLTRNLHVVRGSQCIARHYSVKRHSLQVLSFTADSVPIHYTPNRVDLFPPPSPIRRRPMRTVITLAILT